jgi:UDPglucose 6-dehydrogenase
MAHFVKLSGRYVKIVVIGAGYVGLVLSAGLAELGHSVSCVESDESRRQQLIQGNCPIYEPGLEELLRTGVRDNRIGFSQQVADSLESCEIVFIAVGTPPKHDGSADLTALMSVAQEIGKTTRKPIVVAVKSTVPVGTCSEVERVIQHEIAVRNQEFTCEVVSIPEFLREGSAVNDFRNPDRIVIGSSSQRATEAVMRAYSQLVRNHPRFVVVSRESAELGKYASNAMLATRISLMNELSLLAESVGADIEEVRLIVGSDQRIGRHYLYAGPGFGGSCFPKDLSALSNLAGQFKIHTDIVDAVIDVNERQRSILAQKIQTKLGQLADTKIAVWGVSFKPNTDDIRYSPAVDLIKFLIDSYAEVVIYDPVVKTISPEVDNKIQFADSAIHAVSNADALVLVTEWKEFRNPNFEHLSGQMRRKVLFDFRNVWNGRELRELGFEYVGIGRN